MKIIKKVIILFDNCSEVDALLKISAQKSATIANGVLAKVREKLGYEN
ncbi:hypothetical protein RCH18_000960 [Flavobacterium sp. PL11]|nr:hypothetical protein [Flavobacterium sp. PL11]